MRKNLAHLSSWEPPKNRECSLRLDLNENLYAPPDAVLSALKRALRKNILNMYPEYESARKSIAKYAKVPVQKVLITNGSEEAIQLVIRGLFSQGDSVLIPSPTFHLFYHVLGLEGIRILPLFYSYKQQTRAWEFPLDQTLQKLKEVQGVVLVNPNNPLGVPIPQSALIKILQACRDRKLYVIIDEAYYEFYGLSAKNFLATHKNLFIIRTFSKYFGFSGIRLGYILGHENFLTQLRKIQAPWSVNGFSTFAVIEALKHIREFRRTKEASDKAKNDLYSFFVKQKIEVWPTETNFLVIKNKNSQRIKKELSKRNILVGDLSQYPLAKYYLRNALRITIPTGKDLLRFQKAFTETIKSL